ncbi:MAG: hypothetical protein ACR2PX_03165 [Endozoicomonas sp.]|uniref:hypothetical protein n=1 Tax=Endozoicomonas sp. TaxID=1892382 RepID=UPI003D9B582F
MVNIGLGKAEDGMTVIPLLANVENPESSYFLLDYMHPINLKDPDAKNSILSTIRQKNMENPHIRALHVDEYGFISGMTYNWDGKSKIKSTRSAIFDINSNSWHYPPQGGTPYSMAVMSLPTNTSTPLFLLSSQVNLPYNKSNYIRTDYQLTLWSPGKSPHTLTFDESKQQAWDRGVARNYQTPSRFCINVGYCPDDNYFPNPDQTDTYEYSLSENSIAREKGQYTLSCLDGKNGVDIVFFKEVSICLSQWRIRI